MFKSIQKEYVNVMKVGLDQIVRKNLVNLIVIKKEDVLTETVIVIEAGKEISVRNSRAIKIVVKMGHA